MMDIMGDIVFTLKKDIRSFKNLDPNRKFLVLVLFAGVFLASLVVGSMLFGTGDGSPLPIPGRADQEEAAVPTAVPSTTLSLDPSSATLTAGQAQTVSVMLEGVAVTAADVVVTFDPTMVSVSNLTNGEILPQVIQSDITEDAVVYSASVSAQEPGATDTGPVFTFDVTPLAAASGSEISLQFDPIDTITALEGANTLGTTIGAAYVVE